MKFSILIANYNNGRFFKDCYMSIIAQEYSNWEAVILDDVSTDNSLEIIREIIGSDPRFRIFENAENSGVGITKSKLIEIADGEICGFVDPDDAVASDALSSAVAIFKQKKDIVLTYSKFAKCDEYLKPIEISKMTDQVVNSSPFFFNCPVNIVHFVSFRKEVYEKTEKMNTEMKIAEDQDLYLKMYERGKVQFINKVHYLYRLHSGGISQNSNKPKSKEYFAQVIFNAFRRRNLKIINGKTIPKVYTNPEEIYDLLEYQNRFLFKVNKKLIIFVQKIFN
ncbi:glycosyltransferase [Chryseobacterium sp. JJR-5R]|uniref:glycosyltransferase family 2 protein n=1 Tax=Chryseobacterium sp. JJR-5R TaxID=3093923 RepID=UPI002A7651DD|nr:glycosyltransferase [Chryseobacterium sp. JJR-5R]WPO83063.1 glycosyltransferase [Chryseobacterium sp. JJR-5R]